MNVLIMMTSK